MVKKCTFGIFTAIVCFAIICFVAIGIIYLKYCPPLKYQTGRDTVYIINDGKFQVYKVDKDKHLCCNMDDGGDSTILRKVKKYKWYMGETYICSEDGFAIVDEQNKCRVFLNYTKEEMEQGYITDSDGYRWNFMGELEDAHYDVKILYDFNEFTEKEQKILRKMNDNAED